MKRAIVNGIIAFSAVVLAPQTIQAQGTMTVLSNLDQTSAGSLAVGSDSWLAAGFYTGTNVNGYVLNSIQLGMSDATGNPSGFTIMIYSMKQTGPILGGNLGTLVGSLNPVTGGIFTYTPASYLFLAPYSGYFIVLTGGTAVANGAYEWSYTDAGSYNPSGGWDNVGGVQTSSNGSSWPGNYYAVNAQFAVTVTGVPEPGVFGLSGLGGLCLIWHRRKAT